MKRKRGGQIQHGLSRTSEYRAWQTMRLRCTVPSNPAYADYGGRGIMVCDRWLHDVAAFVADMGMKPSPAHELDRKDNDKGYTPDNCHWTTRTVNSRNRRSNHWVIYAGKQMTVTEACERSGLSLAVAFWRLGRGWTDERTFSAPARHISPKGMGWKPQPKTNKTGFRGVKYDAQRGRYQAMRMVNCKMRYSRRFKTPEEAHRAYITLGATREQQKR